MHKNIIDWLTVHLAPQFSAQAIKLCLEHYSISELCQLSKQQLATIGLKPPTIAALKKPNRRFIDQALNWAQQVNHHLITMDDPEYPHLLKEISDPPPLLYIVGAVQLLKAPQLAIVGSRKASANGLALSRHFASTLHDQGLIITSGMALGIDSAAHRATAGRTIAVLGTGIDILYPSKNNELADKIRQKGAIISEFPLTTPPRKINFPIRNRLISGLTLGVLVVEATQRSGSMITARLAIEQGREVFAVPGSPLNANSDGCNTLIQQGAKLVKTVEDVLLELPKQSTIHPQKSLQFSPHHPPELDKDHTKLLECIGFDTTTFEQLIESTSFSSPRIAALLCNLKLTGYIRETLDGYSRVIQP